MELIEKLLTPAEAAVYLGVKPETLAVWRCTKRYALAYVKVGRRVMYRQKDLDNFIETNLKKGN
jgi:excisionase family DNA binding protein